MAFKIFITGGSRGIGRAIALKFASVGAKVAIAAKSSEPHPKLPGTIYTVSKEIEAAGGVGLPLQVDVRDENRVQEAVKEAAEAFGGLDILINNASAIAIAGTLELPMKRFDLMQACNARACFATSQAALPFLKNANNPHILNLSPPLNMDSKWFAAHLGYTISKYGMSMCTLGMAEEFREEGIAVNSLWPKTTIATSAIKVHFPQVLEHCRTPDIVADAAFALLSKESREFTGNFCIDEELLKEEGVGDFSGYAVDPTKSLQEDFFL